MNITTLSVIEAIADTNECHIIGWNYNDITDYTIESLLPSDAWLGGDHGGYTSDSNQGFNGPRSFEMYLERKYQRYAVFSDEFEREEYLEEQGL